MSGVTIEQAIGEGMQAAAEPMQGAKAVEGMQTAQMQMPSLLEKLKAQTGEGDISSYENHVLNFKKSPAIAKILRGLTGIVGGLNYAVVDIAIGMFEIMQDKKGGAVRGSHNES